MFIFVSSSQKRSAQDGSRRITHGIYPVRNERTVRIAAVFTRITPPVYSGHLYAATAKVLHVVSVGQRLGHQLLVCGIP
jgi:hypothetical protein